MSNIVKSPIAWEKLAIHVHKPHENPTNFREDMEYDQLCA